jgi:hypothetical protein
MNRPVPEGFMTSPPQRVSMPRMAVAVVRARVRSLAMVPPVGSGR